MERLCYETLEKQGNTEFVLKQGAEKVLQFGEGNFLRGFVDYFIDCMNEEAGFNAKVVVVQPIENGMADGINQQDGLYQLYLRGNEGGEKVNKRRLISCISRALNPYSQYEEYMKLAVSQELRYVVSNTTEAGIVYDGSCSLNDQPPRSFPAKLTQFLFERFQKLENPKGLVVLSCELIDDNGAELRRCVRRHAEDWKLGREFLSWLEKDNLFCSTLVDRIVTGYPGEEAIAINEENGYEDRLLDTAEVFGFWVIEGPESLKEELPFEQAGLPVVITDDHSPYKKRKVRILNGAHTTMVMAAYLAGQDIVRDCMRDPVILSFMKKTVFEEIIPTLTLPREELLAFAEAVIERFNNPFIDHRLLDICLNSVSKWKARVLPSMVEYYNINQKLPENIIFSFSAMMAFYFADEMRDGCLIGRRNGQEYKISDDKEVLEFFLRNTGALSKAEMVEQFAGKGGFFGQDLTAFTGFTEAVVRNLEEIEAKGMRKVLEDRA